jgi:hypothetical protein
MASSVPRQSENNFYRYVPFLGRSILLQQNISFTSCVDEKGLRAELEKKNTCSSPVVDLPFVCQTGSTQRNLNYHLSWIIVFSLAQKDKSIHSSIQCEQQFQFSPLGPHTSLRTPFDDSQR